MEEDWRAKVTAARSCRSGPPQTIHGRAASSVKFPRKWRPFEFERRQEHIVAMITSQSLQVCVVLLILTGALFRVTSAKSRYQVANPECTQRYQTKTDMAAAKLLGFGPNGRNFPETQSQLKGYCRETTQLVDQIDGYFKKCYKKEIRDMANILVYSIKSNVRTFCRKKTKKLSKLMENTPCINRNFIHDDKCLVLYANNTKQLIHAKVDDQTKIRHACCFYVTSMRCSDEYLESVPCIRNNKELMLDFVRGIFGSFVDVMCGDYNESSSRCDEIGRPPKPKAPNRKRYNTILFVLLDLLESFKNFGLPNS